MSKKDKETKAQEAAQAESPEIMDITDAENTEEAAVEAEAENADLQGQLETALEEVEKQKKEYLFLMADFDNYRKRTLKEKADLMKNAAERVLLGLLPILDDFERGLASTSDESGDAVREGMQLIYNKFVKYLEWRQAHGIDRTALRRRPPRRHRHCPRSERRPQGQGHRHHSERLYA